MGKSQEKLDEQAARMHAKECGCTCRCVVETDGNSMTVYHAEHCAIYEAVDD